MTRTITLDAEAEKRLATLLREGGYASADAVVQDALRALEAEEAMLRDLDVAAIRRSIEENERDGRTIPADEVFDRLEGKYAALAAQQAAHRKAG